MSNKNSGIILFLMLTLFICGSLLFLNGFFPDAYIKSEESVEFSHRAQPTHVKGVPIQKPKQKYEQVILMIVDAFRYDFALEIEDYMPFTYANHCNRLKLRVAIPTVTLPRIKSLVTGTVSNFIDIIRNLGETEQLSDSLLHVLKKHKRMINFVGDRTWAKLFPTEFTRKKANPDSFFVNDFDAGDRDVFNFTREEINEKYWTLFIAHFLGLDHIGHVEGSNSEKIRPKLLEMDNYIKEICENKFFENRLLLVTGDHGMRNGGGHGGSTEEELTVPLLFFDKKCFKYDTVKEYNQIDVTPTLSILLSVEIPKPSIGRIIPELLTNFTQEERLYAYFYNAQHLIDKANGKYGVDNVKQAGYASWFEDGKIAHKQFIEASRKNMKGSFYYEQALGNYKRVAEVISTKMSESLVKFDYGLIGVGIFLTTTVTIYTLSFLLLTENQQRNSSSSSNSSSDLLLNAFLWIMSLVIALILNITTQEMELIIVNSFQRNLLFTTSITIGVFISLSVLRRILKLILPLPNTTKIKFNWSFPLPLLAAFLMTVFLLGSSSFIEYEHRTWHYLGVTCILWLIWRNICQDMRADDDDGDHIKFKNVTYFLKEFLQKKQTPLTLGFLVLITLRISSVLNGTYNHRWKSKYLNNLKELSLSLLFITSLIFLLERLRTFLTAKQRIAGFCVAFSIFLFRAFQGKVLLFPVWKFGANFALLLFWLLIIMTIFIDYQYVFKKSNVRYQRCLKLFMVCSILIAALLQQTYNVILLPCLLFVLDQTYIFCDKLHLHMREPYKQKYMLACKTLLTIFIANMFFFYQGNSNSLATIDLNPGYIGQSSYNPVIVAIFVTFNTYAAPIHAFFYFILHILEHEQLNSGHQFDDLTRTTNFSISKLTPFNNESLQLVISLYTASILLPVAVYLGLMILFRYHLFIYSVFAPKVFYECYRVLVFYLIYCGLYIFLHVCK